MKQPIEPGDIRADDLIRWESEDGEEAHESRIADPRSTGFTQGKHFLLDRPKVAVELPSEPTLGWLVTYEGEESSGLGAYQTHFNIFEPVDGGITDAAAAGMWPESCIERFTAATPVPTGALRILREHVEIRDRDLTTSGYFNFVRAFLRSIDEAATA